MIESASSRFSVEARNLFSWLDQRVREGGLYYDEESDSWHVFRYAHVAAVYADTETFSSDPDTLTPKLHELERFARGNIVRMDPPRHYELRRLVSKAFTSRRVAGMQPRIVQITRDLLVTFDEGENDDLVAGLTYPLPIMVIAEMLGVPLSDREMFRAWADVLLSGSIRPTEAVLSEDTLRGSAPAMRDMHDYFRDKVAERRSRLGDDLISALIEAEVGGAALTVDDIATFAVLLLVAGHVTTTVLVGSALLCLDAHPAAAVEVRGDINLIHAVVEESMRYQPPFPRNLRRTTRQIEFAGHVIPRDKAVSVWLAAANRDPEVFEDPDVFDIHRASNPHFAFGHGIHFCLGASLARLETRVALEEIFRRYDAIEISAAPEFYPSVSMMLGPTRLPVRLRAR